MRKHGRNIKLLFDDFLEKGTFCSEINIRHSKSSSKIQEKFKKIFQILLVTALKENISGLPVFFDDSRRSQIRKNEFAKKLLGSITVETVNLFESSSPV
jgi:hypothetical protein